MPSTDPTTAPLATSPRTRWPTHIRCFERRRRETPETCPPIGAKAQCDLSLIGAVGRKTSSDSFSSITPLKRHCPRSGPPMTIERTPSRLLEMRMCAVGRGQSQSRDESRFSRHPPKRLFRTPVHDHLFYKKQHMTYDPDEDLQSESLSILLWQDLIYFHLDLRKTGGAPVGCGCGCGALLA